MAETNYQYYNFNVTEVQVSYLVIKVYYRSYECRSDDDK